MNIIVDPLPDTVDIEGEAWAINTDFYRGVLFELLMQDPETSNDEKVEQALSLYYPEMPDDIKAAVDGLIWFYKCGKSTDPAAPVKAANGRSKKAYCFDQDAAIIYSAFYQYYGIDLSTDDIHWWKFRALFQGLPPESEIKQAMGYRTASTAGMTKTQKKHYEKMRKIYALKNNRTVETVMNLVERDRLMIEHFDRRYSEVGEAIDKRATADADKN